MFDALLKSKFYSTSKSEIKTTMRWIEIIKRKRNAIQKFMKNDVADLLENGLHSNAYDRVEQLFADQNLSWCYEFVEKSCALVMSQLTAIDKQRECPEECKEAISTLMFSAARFADLPELRELRSLFYERYENHLEPYVNQEFFKNLKASIPNKETKLQMVQEITMEHGIKWDSKALEPSFVEDWSQYVNEKNIKSHKTHNQNSSETKIQETEKKQAEIAMGHTFKNGLPHKSRAEIEEKEEKHIGNGLPYKSRAEIAMGHTLKNGLPHKSRAEIEEKEEKPIGNGLPYKSRAEIEAQKAQKHDHGHLSPNWSSNSSSCSETTTSPDDSPSEDTPEATKFHQFKSNKKSTISQIGPIFGGKDDNFQNGLRSMGPPYIKRPDLSKKTAGGSTIKYNNHKSEEETEKISKPVPRSMRVRRRLIKRVSGGNNDVSNGESHDLDNGYRDEEEEEEKKMDKLFTGYSRKPLQLAATTRTGSLPAEPVRVAVDERKELTRADTYKPESGLGRRGNVHPKLPDYDDFVARLAAFRASS